MCPTSDRRGFLRGAARLSLAAGITGASALLVLFPRGSSADCIKPIDCDDCAKFDGCDLPKAEKVRGKSGGQDG